VHVFVTGATGLIGRAVCAALLGQGHFVTALSRSGGAGLPTGARPVQGDPTAPGPWLDALAGTDACVHLAGEPVAGGRWTAERKRRIRESRVASTRHIAALLADTGPRVLVSGSAIGIYGPRGDEPLDESSPPGDDFLARVCKEWEAAADGAAQRARVVKLRTGIVLAREGGALPRMALPFKLFAGGPIGDGAFWQSWIHLADEVGLILFALGNDAVSGPLDATAPGPVRNRDLARALGRALHRPSLLPTPVAALRLALGEMANVVASGQRVLPRKAEALGYRFRFPAIDAALADIYPG
jgi:uncharacterized protein